MCRLAIMLAAGVALGTAARAAVADLGFAASAIGFGDPGVAAA
jgi:hypothetical protein